MKKEQKSGLLSLDKLGTDSSSQGRKKSIPEHIEKILKNLPKNPGVYQMKDSSGKVMYVGKAKNLKNRVTSYFREISQSKNSPHAGGLSPAKRQMVSKIADIETIICQTEVEALVLETNLIKHLTPKYNILMKDDKNLSYIKITNSPVPELIKTRKKIQDGAEYYGPFVAGVEQSVRALRRIAKVRNCRMKFEYHKGILPSRRHRFENQIGEKNPQNLISEGKSNFSVSLGDDKGDVQIADRAGKTPPCMDYYIGLCPAPCLLTPESLRLHDAHIDCVRKYLKGEIQDVMSELEEEMREKAKALQFEEAGEIKQTIDSLRSMHERQMVRDIVEGDMDIFLKYEKYEKTYIILLQVRASQMVGVFRYEVDVGVDSDVTIQFLMRQYLDSDDLPTVLLLSEKIEDDVFLGFLRERRIAVEYPQIGGKKSLLDFAFTQIREYAYKREMASLENRTLSREHMANILARLGYDVPKKGEIVFECYDISHTDGHFTYASRVSIVNGKPDTSRYKKYKIKTLADGEIDDFASHREVMMRRTLEGLEQHNFPHLIIIDGGKGQLSSAVSGVEGAIFQYKIKNEKSKMGDERISLSSENGEWERLTKKGIPENITPPRLPLSDEGLPPICSIAKREEEVFLPQTKEPILFEKGTPELMVLQKARDESHRFSITANKSARMKSMKKNILEEIPGIGPITRKKILKLAGSVENIKNIDSEELQKICTKIQIEALRDHDII